MEDGRCRLGLAGRLELVRLAEEGSTLRATARALNVSPATGSPFGLPSKPPTAKIMNRPLRSYPPTWKRSPIPSWSASASIRSTTVATGALACSDNGSPNGASSRTRPEEVLVLGDRVLLLERVKGIGASSGLAFDVPSPTHTF
jgi:hypothetical protein